MELWSRPVEPGLPWKILSINRNNRRMERSDGEPIQSWDLTGLGWREPHSPQNLTLLGSLVPQFMQNDPDALDVFPAAVCGAGSVSGLPSASC